MSGNVCHHQATTVPPGVAIHQPVPALPPLFTILSYPITIHHLLNPTPLSIPPHPEIPLPLHLPSSPFATVQAVRELYDIVEGQPWGPNEPRISRLLVVGASPLSACFSALPGVKLPGLKLRHAAWVCWNRALHCGNPQAVHLSDRSKPLMHTVHLI